MRVGFIGTGVMGNLMARCLLEAGHSLSVHDRERQATANLCDMGAHWAHNPYAVAAASEVVFTSLPGPTEVEQVVLDPEGGILAGLRPGSCYVDTTTNSPALIRRVAQACHERGVDVLDAPVSGRPPDMTMMVGGAATTFTKYKHLLSAMGRDVFHVGDVGQGMVVKAINQFLICAGFMLGAEALLLGAKAGIDVHTLYEVLSATGSGRTLIQSDPYLSRAFKIVFQGDFRTGQGPGGPLNRWVKDVGCAAEVAHDVGAPSPILTVTDDILRGAQAQGWGEELWYGAVRFLEGMTGAELRTSALRPG